MANSDSDDNFLSADEGEDEYFKEGVSNRAAEVNVVIAEEKVDIIGPATDVQESFEIGDTSEDVKTDSSISKTTNPELMPEVVEKEAKFASKQNCQTVDKDASSDQSNSELDVKYKNSENNVVSYTKYEENNKEEGNLTEIKNSSADSKPIVEISSSSTNSKIHESEEICKGSDVIISETKIASNKHVDNKDSGKNNDQNETEITSKENKQEMLTEDLDLSSEDDKITLQPNEDENTLSNIGSTLHTDISSMTENIVNQSDISVEKNVSSMSDENTSDISVLNKNATVLDKDVSIPAANASLLDKNLSIPNESNSVSDKNKVVVKGNILVPDENSLVPDENTSVLDGNALSGTDIVVSEGNPRVPDGSTFVSDEKTLPQEVALKSNEWGWDSWTDDFLVQASNKVSSLLEKVEDQLGIPDPVEMAQFVVQEKETVKDSDETDEKAESVNEETTESDQAAGGVTSWFSSFVPVASITNLVQNTSQELVTGSIGALEFIGKKTVDILSEGDPGFRGKRDALTGKKSSSLSAILNEAKTKAEQQERLGIAIKGENTAKFNDMFETFQGIAHLDALEMLSSECASKLERILNVQSDEVKDESTIILSQVNTNFELDQGDESEEENAAVVFKKQVYLLTKKLKLKVTCSKLLNTWSKIKDKTKDISSINDPKDCLENAISSLAELTSRFMEFYRKVADMLIMTDIEAKQLAEQRASSLKALTNLFQTEISQITNSYVNHLVESNQEKDSDFNTELYLESSNCSTLLLDAHRLLLPILQCGIVK